MNDAKNVNDHQRYILYTCLVYMVVYMLIGYYGIRHGVAFRMTSTELDMLSGDLGLIGYYGIRHGVTFRMTLTELDIVLRRFRATVIGHWSVAVVVYSC